MPTIFVIEDLRYFGEMRKDSPVGPQQSIAASASQGGALSTRLRLYSPSFAALPRAGFIQAFDVMTKTVALVTVLLAGALMGPVSLAAAPETAFTPQNGFGGLSEGDGSLKLVFRKARRFHVESRGSGQGDGTFRLEQTVTFQGKTAQERVWTMTTVGPNQYSAILSDAAGRVTGTTSGPRLSLRYRVKGLLFIRQELRLLPDGKTIDNVGVVTLLGIPVGHLRETITRKGPGITSDNAFRPKPLRVPAQCRGEGPQS